MYRTGKPRFIDKMPNNFRHIGLIHLILPQRQDHRRAARAMACCFSNFKQLFASGQEFTYSIEDIARYYRSYVASHGALGCGAAGQHAAGRARGRGRGSRGQCSRILDFLRSGIRARVPEFYKTERSVRTASSEQVRQPIYREGIDQWRNFEPWLGPLRQALGGLA